MKQLHKRPYVLVQDIELFRLLPEKVLQGLFLILGAQPSQMVRDYGLMYCHLVSFLGNVMLNNCVPNVFVQMCFNVLGDRLLQNALGLFLLGKRHFCVELF